jgi:hypothetical protein
MRASCYYCDTCSTTGPYMTSKTSAPTELAYWLELLDKMPLECDGLARVTSSLLHREGVPHTVHVGSLTVGEEAKIPWHAWITLEDGRIIDLRARMWLPEQEGVPHGLFTPEAHQNYIASGVLTTKADAPVVFYILAERTIEDFPLGIRDAVEAQEPAPRLRPR